jgi:penicillin-insensitive murein endopeptidase
MLPLWIAATLISAQASIAAPSSEPRGQVIGFYNKGRLKQSSRLGSQGKGFIHLFPARNRYYGSQGLVSLLENASAQIADAFPGGERLQIADLSEVRGGPVGQHVSHQNGLDVDLVYFRNNHTEQAPSTANDLLESFVIDGKISPNFDIPRNWQFIRLLVNAGRVNRIFMDPVIKDTFCKYLGEEKILLE